MATDFTVALENRPGTIADLGEMLGKAGVNIEGVCGIPVNGEGLIHILVEDSATTRDVLVEEGFDIRDERDVIVLPADNRPGALGEMARRVADAGVNIDLLYMATDTRVVFGADNVEAARRAL